MILFNMNSVVVVLLFGYVCFVQGDKAYKEKLLKQMEDCSKKEGTTVEEVKANKVPDSSKCFYKCLAFEEHMMDESGKFTLDEAMKIVPPDVAAEFLPENMKVLKDCIAANTFTEMCDSARFVYVCYDEKSKKDS